MITAERWIERAFTHDTPTPCKPPETLYESLSNLPPACSTVITTSRADFCSFSITPVGIPRPSSFTVTEPSSSMITSILEQNPTSASSIELSITPYTR